MTRAPKSASTSSHSGGHNPTRRGSGAEAGLLLRGRIFADLETGRQHRESTRYPGDHYIEVYIVKNGRVVASDHRDVKIVP
jgi:hypothetical protein